MSEETPRTLNHFALLSFTGDFWTLDSQALADFHTRWLAGLRAAVRKVDVYQVFPSESGKESQLA
jgi:hypothetical protein